MLNNILFENVIMLTKKEILHLQVLNCTCKCCVLRVTIVLTIRSYTISKSFTITTSPTNGNQQQWRDTPKKLFVHFLAIGFVETNIKFSFERIFVSWASYIRLLKNNTTPKYWLICIKKHI